MKRKRIFSGLTAAFLAASTIISPIPSYAATSSYIDLNDVSSSGPISLNEETTKDGTISLNEATKTDGFTDETSGVAIYAATDAADMAAAVAVLSDDTDKRLTVTSSTDLSDIVESGKAVYYAGTYVMSFDSESDKDSAYSAIANQLGSNAVTDDSMMSICDVEGNSLGDTIALEIDKDNALAAADGLDLQNSISEKKTLVALIDTGVSSKYCAASVNLTDETDGDLNGHGTKMAQYISKNANGKSEILSIKAFDQNGDGSISNVVSAIKYAVEAGAEIINISASVKDSDLAAPVKDAVQNAVASGITVVVAAGNNGKDASGYAPANVESAVTVGSCDSDGVINTTSNYGDIVDYYVVADSTSEAAAKMTGLLARGIKESSTIFTNSAVKKASVSKETESSEDKLHTDSSTFINKNGYMYIVVTNTDTGKATKYKLSASTNNDDMLNLVGINYTLTKESGDVDYGLKLYNGNDYVTLMGASWSTSCAADTFFSNDYTNADNALGTIYLKMDDKWSDYNITLGRPGDLVPYYSNIFGQLHEGGEVLLPDKYTPSNASSILPVRVNANFFGMTDSEYSGYYLDANCSVSYNATTAWHSTLYIDIASNKKQYTVSYKFGGTSQVNTGSCTDYYKEGEDVVIAKSCDGWGDEQGYKVIGYTSTKGGTTVEYSRLQTVKGGLNKDTTLYAIYGPLSYTFHFDANGGSGTMSDQSRTYNDGVAVSKCTFTNGDLDFLGWAFTPNGSPIINDGNTKSYVFPTEDGQTITLYAVWGKKSLETGTYFQQDIATLMQKNNASVSDIKSVQWITDLDSVEGLSSMPNVNVSDRHVHTDDCWLYGEPYEQHICDSNCGSGYLEGAGSNLYDETTETWYHHSSNSVSKTNKFQRCVYSEGEHMWQFLAYYKDGTLYLYNAENATEKMALNKDSSDMFRNWTSLKSMDFSIFDLSLMQNNVNILTDDTSITAVTFPKEWHFYGNRGISLDVTESGLITISEYWHKEDDGEQREVIWHVGQNGNGAFEGEDGHEADDGCETMVLGLSGDGVGENYVADQDFGSNGTISGLESMINKDPETYAGTWLVGKATEHQYYKTSSPGKVDGIWEVHHPEAPFTTYCWAQHRGPNNGYYDRVEIHNEEQMVANMKVYNQNYGPLNTEQLLLDGETTVDNPMMRTFITLMYWSDVDKDPLNLQEKYGLSKQQIASLVQYAVNLTSDCGGGEFKDAKAWLQNLADLGQGCTSWVGEFSADEMQAAHDAFCEIVSQKYKDIPNVEKIKLYVYLASGGGEQQMGIESLQVGYYGGFEITKTNDVGDPMSGCEFTVYTDEACTNAVRTYTTNADGVAGTCRMDATYGLAVGTYYVKETNTLPGYEQNNDVFKFTVYKDRVTTTGYRNGSETKEAMAYVNNGQIKAAIGKLSLRKVSLSDSSKGLGGAVYGIYAKDDITAERLTGGTAVLYNAGDKIMSVTTDENGYASAAIQQGNYYVVEESAPKGYQLDKETKTDVTVAYGTTNSVTVSDKAKTVTYQIRTTKEIPKGYKIKAGMFTFNLYKQEKSELDSDGQPVWNLVDTATNDADGNVVFKEMTYSADDESDFAGEAQYSIKEVAPTSDDNPRYLYDEQTEYIQITFSDDPNSDTTLTYMQTVSGSASFTNTYITSPEIPNPTKTVTKGKVTLVDLLHNVIDYADSYQYDVYQPIPAETSVDYFKSFKFYDEFPAGINVDSWKVYADGVDITDKWKFTKTTKNKDNDDTRQDTISVEYIGDLNDASAYGVTYDFQFQVTETKEVTQKESFYNYAATIIEYQDVENHYILDADGNVQKDKDGNPLYETTNVYEKDGNTDADPDFVTNTTTDETKAVHYRTTNEVQTDVFPRFTDSSWNVLKHVYNEKGDEINTWAVHNGDIVTYKITVSNQSRKMDGKFTVSDPLPENVNFVDAQDGGVYDEETGLITWTDLEFKAGESYTVTFRVKVDDEGSFTFDNKATVTATCDNARTDGDDPDKEVTETTDRVGDTKETKNMHNYVPEIRKIVTDEDGYNINEVLVSEDSVLTYHLYLYNSDEGGDDPERSGIHTYTITDEVPENTELIAVSEGGEAVRSLPGAGDLNVPDNQELIETEDAEYVTWTDTLEPGEVKVYTFQVKVIGKGVSVVNQAAFATHNTPYDDPDTDKKSDTTYPLVPGETGDADDPEYPSNIVVNGVPSDPLKEVKTLAGDDINQQILQVGDTYQYVITLDNPTACYKTYTLTDVVPAEIQIVKVSESVTTKTSDAVRDIANTKEEPINTVSVDGKNITWVADLQAGETRQFVFTFKPTKNDTHWTNTAHVVISHNVPMDPNTETPIEGGKDYPIERDTNEVENWTMTDPVKIVSATPTGSTETIDMDKMLVFGENADTLTYKISFKNNTTLTKHYTVTDKVDEDLDFIQASDNGTHDNTSRTITWMLDVEAGATKEVTFTAKVNVGDKVASVNNFANVVVDQAYPDSNTTDTDVDTTPTKTVTDKDGKNVDDYLVNKGDELTYTIRVHNPDELTKHFTVYDVVPSGTELQEVFAGSKITTNKFGDEVISDEIAKNSIVDVSQDNTSIIWEADIPSGETWAFQFTVKTTKKDNYSPNAAQVTVDKSVITSETVENWVPGDPMKVISENGEDVSKKVFFTEDQTKVTYEISVKNPANIEKTFTVTDTLDANLTFLSTDNDGKYDKNTRTATWSLTVPAGETKVIKLNVQVTGKTSKEKIQNTANISCDNYKNTTNTVDNYVTNSPVKKTLTTSGTELDGKMIFADNEYKYTITWKNPTEETQTYTVTDVLPDNVTYVSSDNNGKANGQTVTWSNIAVEAGKEKTITVTVKAGSNLENKNVNNKATVKYAGDPSKYSHDTIGSGDNGNATVYISKMSKNVTDANNDKIYAYLVSPGDTLRYHIYVDNPSKKDQTVTITDTIPTGLEITSTDGTINGQTVTWTNATVPAGGKDFVITCTVKSDATATTFTNKATGTANGSKTESNPVENYLLQAPVKTVTTTSEKKDVNGQSVEAETEMTYSISFKNTSSKEQTFTVTDKVAKALSVQKINDDGKMGKDNTITWTATLKAGEEKTVSFTAKAPKDSANQVVENTATVSVDKTSRSSNTVSTTAMAAKDDAANNAATKTADAAKNAVESVNVRATGDASNFTAWIVMGIAAMAVIVAALAFLAKTRKRGRAN